MTSKRSNGTSSKSSAKPATAPKTTRPAAAKVTKQAAPATGSIPAPKAPAPAAAPTPSSRRMPDVEVVLTHDQIARKAYDIWLAKGRPYGQDQTNWDEAIQALKRDANVAAKSH